MIVLCFMKEFRNVQGFKEHSLSNVTISGEGHPIINSKLGAYIDHMKGERKVRGKSDKKDLKVQRTEDYWK
jgi:wyosine [tRNA(Phe)-imidazoG37] synthetase (radical SAM superfamily)